MTQQLENISYKKLNFGYDDTFDTQGIVLPPTAHTSHFISKVFLQKSGGHHNVRTTNKPKMTLVVYIKT